MREKIENYLGGSIDKPNIDKTGFDFLKEWFNSFLTVRKLIFLIIGLLGAKYVVDFFVAEFQLPIIIQKGLGVLLFPLVVVAVIIFIVRTIGLLMTLLLPDIKATDFIIDGSIITFFRSDGKKDIYALNETHNFILTCNFRGILIHATKRKETYSLMLDLKEIETKLDILSNFHKQVTFIQSREGNIRTVWYGNPLFGAENKSFTATNENLNRNNKAPVSSWKQKSRGSKLLTLMLPLLFLAGGATFLGIGIYNSLFRIIPVYSTTFIDEVVVNLSEEEYQKIGGDVMQIVVEKNSEFGNYTGEIHSVNGDYHFSGYTYKKIKGRNYTLAGWTDIPKTKQFTLKMSPETKNPFTLTINYIK